MTIKGNVINTAMAVEESMVMETTIGIGLINSPMIPLANKSGTNDQMVVIVVDQMGIIVSLQTISPVSKGVNFPVL